MALDGIILAQLVKELKKPLPLRINKIYQISNTELLFPLIRNTTASASQKRAIQHQKVQVSLSCC